MWFSTNILSVILRLNVFFVGKVEFIVVGLGLRMHSNLVSAMELALMGGWPTKDGRAGSVPRQLSSFRRGQAESRGRPRPFFLPGI